MRVGFQREGRAGVPDAFGDNLEVNARRQELRDVRVAQIVKPHLELEPAHELGEAFGGILAGLKKGSPAGPCADEGIGALANAGVQQRFGLLQAMAP